MPRRSRAVRSVLVVVVAALTALGLPALPAASVPTIEGGGQLVAWGRNGDGQVGDGTTTNQPAPVAIEGLTDIVSATGGYFHSVALRADGTVLTWGSDDSGQLGNGAGGATTVPDDIVMPGERTVVDVDAEGFQTAAVASDGTLWRWGSLPGLSAQAPTQVQMPEGVGATHVAAGVNHLLVLGDDGHVYALGNNCYGQLGNGAATGTSLSDCEGAFETTDLVQASELSGVVEISAGQFHSSARTSGGAVWTWGLDQHGQLGACLDGDTSNTPVQALSACGTEETVATPVGDAIQVSAGSTHTLVLTGTSTLVAGNPLDGSGASEHFRSFGLGSIVQLSAGELASFFLRKDGVVFAAGDNRCGQLGIDVDASCDSAEIRATQEVPALQGALLVSAGHFTNYAVLPAAGAGITDLTLTTAEGDDVTPPGVDEIDLRSIPVTNLVQRELGPSTAPLKNTPLKNTPLKNTPLKNTPLKNTPLKNTPVGTSPLKNTPLKNTPVFAPLKNTPLKNTPLKNTPLYNTPLASMPLLTEGGWQGVLDACSLGATPQGTTLGDLLSLDPACGAVGDIELGDLNLATSPLGEVSLLSLLLGVVTWADITPPTSAGWCAEFTAVGATCPDLADATALSSDLQGVAVDEMPLAARRVSDIAAGARSSTVFWGISIVDLNIVGGPLGLITFGDLTAAGVAVGDVVDCGSFAGCGDGSMTLADAARADAILPGATYGTLGGAIDDLSLADVAVGFIDPTALPWEDLPLADAQFERLSEDEGVNFVTYQLDFDVACSDTAGLVADIDLPDTFAYRPGSTQVSQDGGDPVALTELGSEPSVVVSPTETALRVHIDLGGFGCEGSFESQHLQVLLDAMPAFTTGVYRADASVASDTDEASVSNEAPVRVQESLEPNDAPGSAQPLPADSLTVGQIGAPGDLDYYEVSVDPGQVLSVSVSHLTTYDADLVVYAPVGADSRQLLRAPGTVRSISFGGEPISDPGSAIGRVLPPAPLQDLPIVEGRVVETISSFRGTETEQMSTVAVPGSADNDYLIQVSGYNGASGPEPYVLTIRVSDPQTLPATCAPRTLPGATASAPGGNIPAGTETIVLINGQRIEQLYGSGPRSDVEDAVASLGHLLPVDADADVRAAYSAFDADPCSPQAANNVVRKINDYVDSLNPPNSLKNVVLVGDDTWLPHARIADKTRDGNEIWFTGEALFTSNNNQFAGAFGNSFYLSDTPYAAFNPLEVRGQIVYLPQVAYGRLPGDPQAILDAVDRFTTSGGLADGRSATQRTALMTDYDFFTDAGQAMTEELGSQFCDTSGDCVTRLSGAWTRAQLSGELRSSDPADVLSPNAHYDQYRLLPGEGDATGDESELFTTADLEASAPPDLTGRIVYSIGCHFGLSVTDDVGAAGDPRVRDWAQTYDGLGTAVMIGNLGYGFGDSATTAFGERLLTGFTEQLGQAPTVGQAMRRAQRSYFTTLTTYSPYDIKTIEQAVVWGVPMYTMVEAPTAAAASVALTTTSATIGVDPLSGLDSTEIAVDPVLSKEEVGGKVFISGSDGTVAVHGYPVMPKEVEPIPPADGLVAHGAVPVELSLEACPGLPASGAVSDYAFANATIDDSSIEPAPASDTVFPTANQSIGTSYGIGGAAEQDLIVVPGRFTSGDPPDSGFFRCFSGTWQVTYDDAGETDFVGPTFETVEAIDLGTATAFLVEVSDPNGGVARVFVQALLSDGTYRRIELAHGTGSHWSGVFPGTNVVEFTAFALDGNGNASVANNKGPGYEPVEAPPTPPGDVTVTFTPGTPDGGGGWYVSTPTVTVTPSDLRVRIDGGDPEPTPATIDGDGVHTVEVLNGGGDVLGTHIVFVDTTAPAVVFTTPPAGSPYTLNTPDVTSEFECVDPLSGVDRCDGPGIVDTSVVGIRTFSVDVRDVAGNAATRSQTYEVTYADTATCPGGRQALAPISPDGTSVFRRGSVVPVKFRVFDAGCTSIGPLPRVPLGPPEIIDVDSGVGTIDEEVISGTPDTDFRWDETNRQWVFNMSTRGLRAGRTYTFEVELNDGTSFTFVFGVR